MIGGKVMITVEFTVEKETKNAIRFKEVTAPDQTPTVGTIYIPKATLKAMGWTPNRNIKIDLNV